MAFSVYNTASATVEPFTPQRPGQVSIYCCGLTVQGQPHIGHLRKEVVFDLLRRWLEVSGYTVTLVTNVTDIDDKILAKSAAAGLDWWAWAYRFERELHQAYAALGLRAPTYEPRATGHIPEMVELVQQLIAAGHAYVATDGSADVYFDVKSWPDYGELSHQKLDEMEPAGDGAGFGKRDPRDFALWKGAKPGEPATAAWPAPWGRGRPGWHLECTAMATKYLGDVFDIHGGGIDLKFPHHENELAQARAAGRGFARYWMHNAWLTMAGEKMSKSLSNGLSVAEVTRRWPARAVRAYLVGPHYRSTVDYSDAAVDEAATALARIDSFVTRAGDILGAAAGGRSRSWDVATVPTSPGTSPGGVADRVGLADLPARFSAALDDDLGTPAALAVIHETVREGNRAIDAGQTGAIEAAYHQVQAMLDVFGLRADDPVWRGGDQSDLTPLVDALVAAVLDQRQAARARRDFAAADALRDQLTNLGVTIEDTPQGPRWSRS